MKIPAALETLARDREFWSRYFWQNDDELEYGELANEVVIYTEEFLKAQYDLRGAARPIPPGHSSCLIELDFGADGLQLDMPPDLTSFELGLKQPSGSVIQLGWDDQAHWHPHVFRWTELATICSSASSTMEPLANQDLLLLLLCRFAPITSDPDFNIAEALLKSAWKNLGLECRNSEDGNDDDSDNGDDRDHDDAGDRKGGGDDLYDHVIEKIDCRNNGFEWRLSAKGWVLSQDDENEYDIICYSLRHIDNDEFPFVELSTMIAEAAERRN